MKAFVVLTLSLALLLNGSATKADPVANVIPEPTFDPEHPKCLGKILECSFLLTVECEEAALLGIAHEVEGCCGKIAFWLECLGEEVQQQCLPVLEQIIVETTEQCEGEPTAAPTELPDHETCVTIFHDCSHLMTPACFHALIILDEEEIGKCCEGIDATIACLESKDPSCENEVLQDVLNESMAVLGEGSRICGATPEPTSNPEHPKCLGKILECSFLLTVECEEAALAGIAHEVEGCCGKIAFWLECLGEEVQQQCLPVLEQIIVETTEQCEGEPTAAPTELPDHETCVTIFHDCSHLMTPACFHALIILDEAEIGNCCEGIDATIACLESKDPSCENEVLQDVLNESMAVLGEGSRICGATPEPTSNPEHPKCLGKILECSFLLTVECEEAALAGIAHEVEGCCGKIAFWLECLGEEVQQQCLPVLEQIIVETTKQCEGEPTAAPTELPDHETCVTIFHDCSHLMTPACFHALIILDEEEIGNCCEGIDATIACLESKDPSCENEVLQDVLNESMAVLGEGSRICAASPTPGPDCAIVSDCAELIRPECVEAVLAGDKEATKGCCDELDKYVGCVGDFLDQCLPEDLLGAIEEAEDVCKVPMGIFSMFPCKGRVTYKVTISYSWSSATHPNSYPDGGGFSPYVLASHGKDYTMWSKLGYSSPGVQEVAETGNPDTLESELKVENYRNVFQRLIDPDGPAGGTDTRVYMIDVHGARSYISGIAMLAPSPDWFTGISGLNTCDEDAKEYLDRMEGYLSAYDAGTDAGDAFMAPDEPRKPGERRPIVSILNDKFEGITVGKYVVEKA